MATPLAPALPRLGQRERRKNRQLAACRFRLLVRIPGSPSPSRAKLQSRAHLFSLTPAIRRNSPASRWTRPLLALSIHPSLFSPFNAAFFVCFPALLL